MKTLTWDTANSLNLPPESGIRAKPAKKPRTDVMRRLLGAWLLPPSEEFRTALSLVCASFA